MTLGNSPDVSLQVAYISAVSALAGAIIGGLIGYLGQYLLRRSELGDQSRQLARALRGEINALRDIVERRKYVRALRDAAKSADVPLIQVRVKRDYFKIFDVNADKIGLLPGDLPELVTSFYVRASALVEDFDYMSNATYENTSVEDRRKYYTEVADLMEETMAIGQQTVTRLDARIGRERLAVVAEQPEKK